MVHLNTYAQETVYLQSFKYGAEMEHGRGIIKTRPGECFVIAPKHVVHDSIVITGESQIRSTGKVEKVYSKNDLAIVRITGGGQQNCSDWSLPKNFATIISEIGIPFLEVRNKSGAVENIPVTVKRRTGKTITIVPKDREEGYIKGMSGAALFGYYGPKKIFLGLFLSVDAKSNTGLVLRADEIVRITGDIFNPKRNSGQPDTTVNNISLKLTKCQKIGNNVKCNFEIQSTEKDKDVRLDVPATKIFDLEGKVYPASVITLANKSDTRYVNLKLIKGIPTNCEIQFKYVNTKVEGLAKIVLSFYDNEHGNYTIDFKNVFFTLSKDADPYTQAVKGVKCKIIQCESSVKTVLGRAVWGSVYCKFSLESLSTNEKVTLEQQNIVLVNEKGEAKRASEIALGDLIDDNYIQYSLVQNIPLEGVIRFNKALVKKNKIKFLTLTIYSSETGDISFEFTNVPIKKGFTLMAEFEARKGKTPGKIPDSINPFKK